MNKKDEYKEILKNAQAQRATQIQEDKDQKKKDEFKKILKQAKQQKGETKTYKELEEEKKIPKRVKKEIKLPESTNRKSSINWVSRDDRDTDNLYDD